MAFLDKTYIYFFYFESKYARWTFSEWMQMRSKHKCTQLTQDTSSLIFTSLSEWMQLRSILNCTQLTQDANTTYNMIHFFRMNATKEHTQSHTTYSRCITLQALFTYLFYFFLSSFFFSFFSFFFLGLSSSIIEEQVS